MIKGRIALLIFVLVAEGLITGLIPYSQGNLYGMLGVKSPLVWTAIGYYFLNLFGVDFFQCVKGFLVAKVAMFYREARTVKVLLSENLEKTPNHDQRIQEDIKLSYVNRITVWCEYFVSAIILVQLVVINITEPLLLGCAAGYAVISLIIAARFNKKLSTTEQEVQTAEADFRVSVKHGLGVIEKLSGAAAATIKIAKVQMHYKLFTKLQLGIMTVLPFIVLVPQLLAGTMLLGEVIQHQATFALLVVNAAILIQYYTVLIQGKASELRVRVLHE